jgi:REP element-mobilizing transposase RayT
MPHTSTHNYLHIVFGTKRRASSIPESMQPKLWAYRAGICRNYEVLPLAIGGMEDHIHLLLRLPPILALAKCLTVLKANSSRWMNDLGAHFAWQEGYGAFSVSSSNLKVVEKYIREQKLHHRTMSFMEEYRALLQRHENEMGRVPPSGAFDHLSKFPALPRRACVLRPSGSAKATT